jgi:iron(III) transport system ATP-binding protein
MLSVRGLTAEYRSARTAAVQGARDVSFEAPRGKLFTLLGPSGCGKTTTLRSIAGLERPVAGEIEAGGRVVFSAQGKVCVAVNKRNFGMVFQSYAIWPHMTVLQNAAFPLEARGGLSRQAIRERAMRVLDAVRLSEFAERQATQLSGGQQQRLALARALVMEPELLLLDEPLSNLDARLRERMRLELKRIQHELSITTIYVTHDQAEALALSHEIAVMKDGRIVQTGSPRTIYERPASRFVAEFIGGSNFIAGEIIGDAAAGFWRVHTSLGDLIASSASTMLARGQHVTLCIRPENLRIGESAREAGPNLLRAKLESRLFQGDCTELQLRAGETVLVARAHPSVDASEGQEVELRPPPETCSILPPE